MIKYKQGDLFDNLTGNEIIAHACNAQGVWGSGFAKQCKERFPINFNFYRNFCFGYKKAPITGTSILTQSGPPLPLTFILCLLTSEKYGRAKDEPQKIVENTRLALQHYSDLMADTGKNLTLEIVSPKINAGLFGVPWSATEFLIMEFIGKSGKNIKWTVFEK